MSKVFRWPVRVYYEDTDAGGVLYHASYLRFFERTRTEWLRALGFEQTQLLEQFGLLFAVRQMSIDYLRPARLDDLLNVSLEVLKTGKASMQVLQQMHREDELLSTATVKIACITEESFKPAPIPDMIKKEIAHA